MGETQNNLQSLVTFVKTLQQRDNAVHNSWRWLEFGLTVANFELWCDTWGARVKGWWKQRSVFDTHSGEQTSWYLWKQNCGNSPNLNFVVKQTEKLVCFSLSWTSAWITGLPCLTVNLSWGPLQHKGSSKWGSWVLGPFDISTGFNPERVDGQRK